MIAQKDLNSLPDQLLEQLGQRAKNPLLSNIISIIADNGKASVDLILVNLYRMTGEVHKRRTIYDKLYILVKRGLIKSIGKGVYTCCNKPEAA